MANILDILNEIGTAIYGRDVRQAIIDAIRQCYEDGKAGVNDLHARTLIEAVMAVNEQQAAEIETLTARVEELEEGESGGSSETSTTSVPTFLVESGTTTFENVGANKTATQAITFTENFTEAPTVLAIKVFRQGANTFYSQVTAQPIQSSITATGFTLAVGNKYTQAVSPSVLWVAFQPTTVEVETEITTVDGMTEADVRALLAPITAALNNLKIGYDGTEYDTPGASLREQINALHVLIGDEPGTAIQASAVAYEDSNVADELTGINGRLEDLSLHPVKNLVTELLPLSTNQVLTGRTVTLTEVDVQRATAVVDVEGGKTYTVNQVMSNSFSGFADADNKWIGPVNDYKTEDYIFTAPVNAKKLYLCNTGWTVNQGLVVLEGDTVIIGTTKTEYPFNTVVRLEPSVPIEPYDTEITELEADKNFLLTQMDAQGVTFGQDAPVFSGNSSTADPVIVTVGRIYYKSKKATGDMYLSSDDLKNLSFSIGSGQGLVFDYDTKTAYVTDNMTVTSYSLQNKVILVWKQGVAIKGAWAWIYADTVIKNGLAMFNRSITKRLMQRQGEGYGLPDNSLVAVKTALKDGWNNIKISVANTSDNVVYCTHSYEMRNNKALDLNYITVKASGDVYDGNVAINNVTSAFINTLQYKGYDIPTLDAVLAYICRFDVKLTIEVKDRMSATAVQNMLDSCAFYGVTPVYSCDRYNAEDLLAVSTDVDVAAVFHYSAENAQTAYTAYKDRCKSLRFDIVYGDNVPKADVVAWHNLGVKFKLGGRQPTQAMFEDAIQWCDDIEVYGKNQMWIDRLINETW